MDNLVATEGEDPNQISFETSQLQSGCLVVLEQHQSQDPLLAAWPFSLMAPIFLKRYNTTVSCVLRVIK